MTRFIADVMGSGLGSLTAFDAASWPPFDDVNSTATRVVISLALDGDTLTCTPKFVRADGTSPSPPVVETVSKYVFVATGPINYDDKRSSYPSNGTDLYATAGPGTPPLTSLSLKQTLPPSPTGNISALPRVVDCTVRARDAGNDQGRGLPIVITGSAAIVDDGTGTPRVYPDWLFPLAICGGVYTANATDNANCGSCGAVCPAGSTCSFGTCICSQIVTSSVSLTASVARNLSVVLVGGGGGAAGLASSDASLGNSGGGGGGGSSAIVINGVAALVAPGGAGGTPGGPGANNTAADAAGLPGSKVSSIVVVPAGASVAVYVGGGGGGGGAATVAAGVGEKAGGGGGGAGFYGGCGGFGGVTNAATDPRPHATGGGASAGGAGYVAGSLNTGGTGQARQCAACPPRTPAAGGTLASGGLGATGRVFFSTTRYVGGTGGGGAFGGGGGAGSAGSSINNAFGLDGGGPGAPGGGGAAGSATWAAGIKVGVGSGGVAAVPGQQLPQPAVPPVNQGGAAGLAVLRWPVTGGVCVF